MTKYFYILYILLLVSCLNRISKTPNLEIEEKKDVEKYTTEGYWKFNCESGGGYLDISENQNVVIEVNSNQIYLKGSLVEITTNKYQIKYHSVDIGRGGNVLEWNTFVKDSSILNIEFLSDSKINYKWRGFYNSKSKQFEWVEQSELGRNTILNKCVYN